VTADCCLDKIAQQIFAAFRCLPDVGETLELCLREGLLQGADLEAPALAEGDGVGIDDEWRTGPRADLPDEAEQQLAIAQVRRGDEWALVALHHRRLRLLRYLHARSDCCRLER
jgi:hypothetical protein